MRRSYQTLEFWMSLAAMLLGALASSGAITPGTPYDKAIGVIMSVLAAMGYTASRSFVKAKLEEPKATASTVIPPSALVFILLPLLALGGCCAFHGTCGGSIGPCAKEVVKEKAPALLPILADLFANGQSNIEDELSRLATALGGDGFDIIACAVRSFFDDASLKLKGKPADLAIPLERGHARAGEWLKAHGR